MATRLTVEQRQEAARWYNAGMRSEEIASRLGIRPGSVSKVVKEGGGVLPEVREARKRRGGSYDLAPLVSMPLSPEAKYWLGLLYTDGCICRQGIGWSLSLGLAETDLASVEGFRSFIKAEQKIHRRKQTNLGGQDIVYLRLYSTVFADQLAPFGIVPQKSVSSRPGEMLRESPDFWRGAIDGNGWLGLDVRNRLFLGLAGTKDACKDFWAFCHSITGTETRPTKAAHAESWSLKLSCRNAAIVMKALYDRPGPAMARKQGKALGILSGYRGLDANRDR